MASTAHSRSRGSLLCAAMTTECRVSGNESLCGSKAKACFRMLLTGSLRCAGSKGNGEGAAVTSVQIPVILAILAILAIPPILPFPAILRRMTLSVCIITLNEEANIVRTLKSIEGIADETIVVDSGSTDQTMSLAQARGAKVFTEPWKGFAPQKNSALAKATCDWILSLDADEEVSPELAASIKALLKGAQPPEFAGYKMN